MILITKTSDQTRQRVCVCFFFCKVNVPHFFTSSLLGMKSQNCVPSSTVAPWVGGPIIRVFYSSQGVSSYPLLFFGGGWKEYSLS